MAKLGNVFLNTVFEDKPEDSVKTTDHPIEGGFNYTDHIHHEPFKMSISGIIAGADAETRRKQLKVYMSKGTRLTYIYRTVQQDLIIESFSPIYDVDVKNGFKFNIELKQIKIAKKAEKIKKKRKTTNGGRKQPAKPGTKAKKIYTVKKGDTLSEIAYRYGMSTNTLYNKNKKVIGKNKDLIYPGQKLVL